jgi:NAD(P)H-hydrate epimerase
LPDRPADGHKGTFGTLIIVGGSCAMLGAPALAAMAGLRGGAGLVRLAVPCDVLGHCLTIEPAATGLPLPTRGGELDGEAAAQTVLDNIDHKTVLAIGPGLGTGRAQQRLIEKLIDTATRPVVVDADGLNNLAQLSRSDRPGQAPPLVLTPHPGEYRRLAEAAGIDADPVDPATRPDAAEQLARHYQAVVVLKGRNTIIARHDGHVINQTGNPALATAGSGDVLTGLIGALIAQGLDCFDAARLGVALHGLAGDCWATQYGRRGLTAADLARQLPEAMNHWIEARS